MNDFIELYVDDKSKKIIYYDCITSKLISCNYSYENQWWAFIITPLVFYILDELRHLFFDLNVLNRVLFLFILSMISVAIWNKIMSVYYKNIVLNKNEIIIARDTFYKMSIKIRKHYMNQIISFIIIIILILLLLSFIILSKELFLFIPLIILIFVEHYLITCFNIFNKRKVIKKIANDTFESESIY